MPDPHVPEERLFISIATYDEADNIVPLLEGVLAAVPAAHVVVVDDNSPDGTGDLVAALAERRPSVHLIRRAGKLGYATAHLEGMRLGLERGASLLGTMDADFSHDPAALPSLLAATADADLVIGSRYVEGGGVVNWPWYRVALSRAGGTFARTMLRLPVRDPTGGYRVYRADLLQRIRLEELRAEGYAFLIESLYRCLQAGARIREVPITFADRERGRSKISKRIIAESFCTVLRLAVRPRS
jgi:dolichol-phosphate mannosyltransferase